MTLPPAKDPSGAGAPQEDSLPRRFGYKLSANFLGLPLNLATQWLITRALGPAGYGHVAYLTGFFNEVVNFFDAGTSTAFYTKLCARQRESGLIAFYWRLVLAITVAVSIGTVAIASCDRPLQTLWPKEHLSSVLIAALAVLATWIVTVANKIVDAFGLTAKGEVARVVRLFASACGFALLFLGGWLNLRAVFGLQIFFALLQVGLWQRVALRGGRSLFEEMRMPAARLAKYAREFWSYSHPLLLFAVAAMIGGLADRWLLQHFAGSVEQGFYGLSVQVGNFCFLFTSAMVPLLAREFSQAVESNDLARIRRHFFRSINGMFSISAIVGVGIAFQAGDVARLIGGAAFANAKFPMAIMCFFPIYQTYGQINISLFYATSRTRLHRNLGLGYIATGLVASYWVLVPRANGGLGMGSVGLAVKMVSLQFVAVNVQLWFNTKRLGLAYLGFIGRQARTIGTLAFIAMLTSGLVGRLALPAAPGVFLGTGFYLLAVALVLWRKPQLIAVSIEDRRTIGRRIQALRHRFRAA